MRNDGDLTKYDDRKNNDAKVDKQAENSEDSTCGDDSPEAPDKSKTILIRQDNNDAIMEQQKFRKTLANLNEFTLEHLFYQRNKIFAIDGQLHVFVEIIVNRGREDEYIANYFELLTEKKLESLILKTLENELRDIGKVGMVKSVAKLVKMRPIEDFPTVSSKSKVLAFKDVLYDIDTANHPSTNYNHSYESIVSFGNCKYQFNFNFDYNLLAIAYQASNGYPVYLHPSTEPALQHYERLFKGITLPYADQFFSDIAEGNQDIVRRIYEMIGYILVPGNEAKAFFLLQGESNSGKSVLGKFLEGYFPLNKVTSLDIGRLGEKYLPESLATSCLNLSMDLPEGKLSSKSVAIIKMLTGDDLVTHEVKFKDARPYRGNCKLLFSTNFPLNLKAHDPAFLNRIVCIPFIKSIPKEKQNKDLPYYLERERAAITTKALASYYLLRSRNFEFSGSKIVQPKLEYQLDLNDVIRTFVDERCFFCDSNEFISTQKLFDEYLLFCKNENIKAVRKKEGFSSRLSSLYGHKISSTKKDGVNGYIGIKLKIEPMDFFDEEPISKIYLDGEVLYNV